MSKYAELISRLEKAVGPDRELDRAVFDRLCGGVFKPDVGEFYTRDSLSTAHPVHFTASVDAALALVERVLPGWDVNIEATDGMARDVYLLGPGYKSNGSTPDQESKPVAGKPTAIALCIALLSALDTQEQDNG